MAGRWVNRFLNAIRDSLSKSEHDSKQTLSAIHSMEQLETRLVMDGDPRVTLLGDANPFVGETYNLIARFDNANLTDVGYGPYIDLYLPRTGADGAGAQTDDGISFASATYLGAAVNATLITFNSSGQATHPYAVDSSGNPLVVSGTAGDQLVVLELPFGSFTGDQPPADIQVQLNLSNLADVGTPLAIQANAGFRYGNDPLNNPSTDPTTTQLLQTTSLSSLSVTPTLLKLRKEYIGPEDETATGPNFQRQYRIHIDVANGQTLTNLDVTDLLPNTMQYVDSQTSGSATITSTPSLTTPGGTLTWRFASVTGTTSDSDARVDFDYFIPRIDAASNPIIDATSADDVLITNNAQASGTWSPIDTRDTQTVVISDETNADHVLTAKSIAVQKSVAIVTDTNATGATPGDVLEYTIDFQVSDYFAFENLLISDLFSDGQRFDLSFNPTLSVTEHGSTSTGNMSSSNFLVALNADNNPSTPATDGSTTVTFNVSDELIARALDGILLGGGVPVGGVGSSPNNNPPLPFGGTTGRITFRTIIQDDFSDTFPSGDSSVDQGDVLDNSVSIAGDVVSAVDGITSLGTAEADNSAASVEIVRGELTKSIYAVNGSTSLPSTVRVSPGDIVTYRIRYSLPISSFDGLTLTDFLPLPVFLAGDVTTFNAGIAGTVPGAGVATYGPADTFRLLAGAPAPVISTNATANSVTFTYSAFDDPAQPTTEIDILFSVTVQDDPFADGLFLTNQVRSQEGTTNSVAQVADEIVQLILGEPALNIQKGIVATSNSSATFTSTSAPTGITFNAPGTTGSRFSGGTINSGNLGTTLNANLRGADAGDLVTFAIVIENEGGSQLGAYDIRLQDTLPVGFAIPAGGLNLRATDGTGALFTIVDLGGGLFGTGIELADPGPTSSPAGALDAGLDTNGNVVTTGANIAVITFDLQIIDSVRAAQSIVNTATVFNYTNLEGGTNFTPDGKSDTAQVEVTVPDPTKSIVATSETHTSESGTGSNASPRLVAIGEIVRYRVVVPIAEGTSPNVRLRDNLPAGLTFLDDSTARIAFVSNGGLTSSTLSGTGLVVTGDQSTIASITPTFVIPDAAIAGTFSTGTDPIIQLGDLTNADRDNNIEYVVIEFNALVDNSVAGSNDAGENRDNTTTAIVDGSDVVTSDEQVRVRIVEPSVSVDKVSSPTGGFRDTLITYTVTLSASSLSSSTTSFDVRFTDTLPASLTNAALVSVTPTGNVQGLSSSVSGNQIFVNADSMDPTDTITIVYTARIATTVNPGDLSTNSAEVRFTSLPGSLGTASNPTGSTLPGGAGTNLGERDGSGSQNDYIANDAVQVLAANNVISGFSYIDADNDGVFDSGETPLPGITIQLTGTSTGGDIVNRTTLTLADGSYRFDELLPGTYTLVQTQPAGLQTGQNTPGTNFGGTGQAPSNNSITNISIGNTTFDTQGANYNFGDIAQSNSSIAGTVYVDTNANGVIDTNELRIQGVTVRLTGVNALGNAVDITTLTDANGNYSFANLFPGNYIVTETQPSAFVDGIDSLGSLGGTLQNDRVTSIQLFGSQNATGYNFGENGLNAQSVTKRYLLTSVLSRPSTVILASGVPIYGNSNTTNILAGLALLPIAPQVPSSTVIEAAPQAPASLSAIDLLDSSRGSAKKKSL